MNRITNLFKQKKGPVLSIYMTAGYPKKDDTIEILKSLQSSGVDMVEIGMPFSDPLADGPVIQKSSQQALENGMSIRLLFEQLSDIRKEMSIPLILMGYLNPVLQFGFSNFLNKCHELGIDGIIIPDLPIDIFERDYKESFKKFEIEFIMLITPQTSEKRIYQIVNASVTKNGGFLYMVADSSTTGAKSGIGKKQIEYFQRINDLKLEIPRLIGFGISNADTFNTVAAHSDGAIIGSAFIQAIGIDNDIPIKKKVLNFVTSIRNPEQV